MMTFFLSVAIQAASLSSTVLTGIERAYDSFSFGGVSYIAVGTRENPQPAYPTRCGQTFDYYVRILAVDSDLIKAPSVDIASLKEQVKFEAAKGGGLEPCQPMYKLQVVTLGDVAYVLSVVQASRPILRLYRLDKVNGSLSATSLKTPDYPSFEGSFLGSMQGGFQPQLVAVKDDVLLVLPDSSETLGVYSLTTSARVFRTKSDEMSYIGGKNIPYITRTIGEKGYLVDGSNNSGVKVYRLPDGKIVGDISWYTLHSMFAGVLTCSGDIDTLPNTGSDLSLILACRKKDIMKSKLLHFRVSPDGSHTAIAAGLSEDISGIIARAPRIEEMSTGRSFLVGNVFSSEDDLKQALGSVSLRAPSKDLDVVPGLEHIKGMFTSLLIDGKDSVLMTFGDKSYFHGFDGTNVNLIHELSGTGRAIYTEGAIRRIELDTSTVVTVLGTAVPDPKFTSDGRQLVLTVKKK